MKTDAQLYTYSNLRILLQCKGKNANVIMPLGAMTTVKFKSKIV